MSFLRLGFIRSKSRRDEGEEDAPRFGHERLGCAAPLLEVMNILWLTLADPYPVDNGQFIYSAGLIRALELSGASIHACGFYRPGDKVSEETQGGIARWRLASHRPRSRWRCLLSPWPALASRTQTQELRQIVEAELEQRPWDVVVFDSIALAWAIGMVVKWRVRTGNRATIVYLSHNHEESVATAMATQERRAFNRLVRQFDAWKMRWRERSLSRQADLITANTPEDRARFAQTWPDKPTEFLPPGYQGPKAEDRRIMHATLSRRALIVGSFHWPAKQHSLEAFLDVADPMFAKAGIELLVVGNAEEAFLERQRKRVVATCFTGRVADIFPYMQDARIAVVPDLLGGFKLKTLDYIFSRLPIFAIDGSVPGLPLEPERSIFVFPDHHALAHGIVSSIDDLDRLNVAQDEAYLSCRDQFDWTAIGRRLLAAIDRATDRADAVRIGHPMRSAISH
ncbi:MAG TPA: glycosyltransferase [Magnetospirillaceae bacterium]|jgi:glycosyltransferase involved in cell wall biosynthesis